MKRKKTAQATLCDASGQFGAILDAQEKDGYHSSTTHIYKVPSLYHEILYYSGGGEKKICLNEEKQWFKNTSHALL